MPIVLISSSPHGRGGKLAQNLAQKTGWPIYSRDQVAAKARETGIKLSRLETSIIKTPVISEKLAREKNLYLALFTKIIFEKAIDGNLIYHGRAGHLLTPGIPGLLRVGLGSSLETRIEQAMQELNLPREKAREYLVKLDEDIKRWTHYVHQETAQSPSAYDLFLNLQHMSLENASAILHQTAMLSDFKPTAESRSMMEDKCLAARAKIHLAQKPETAGMDLSVRAVNGVVTVTYMPLQEASSEIIYQTLKELPGCREIICTMAETNILWIQESFDPEGQNFGQVTQLAKRWGAAVELLRFDSEGADRSQAPVLKIDQGDRLSMETNTGGVEDDDTGEIQDDKGLAKTVEKLVEIGRSAGGFLISGAGRDVINAVKDNNYYSLIVLGNLFVSKGHESSTRLTRELGLDLREKLKAPVIASEELHSEFFFGKAQALKLIGFILATVLIYSLVFSFQEPILNMMGGDFHSKFKWAAPVGVALLIPLVAYVYSSVTGLVLKIIDID